jgi:hypothetical protein
MLLFPREEHDQIKAGKLTVTFRDWDRIRVEAGHEYKSFDLGFVRVDEVGYIDLKKIPDEDLKAAGFDNMEDFKAVFRKRNPGFNFSSGRLIRIKYSYLGSENRTAAGVKPNERDLIRIMERLVEIDVMSEMEAKSDDFLQFLDLKEPKTSLTICQHFKLPREVVRKRMAQMKNEGLVASLRDGYVITVRGQAYLDSKI